LENVKSLPLCIQRVWYKQLAITKSLVACNGFTYSLSYELSSTTINPHSILLVAVFPRSTMYHGLSAAVLPRWPSLTIEASDAHSQPGTKWPVCVDVPLNTSQTKAVLPQYPVGNCIHHHMFDYILRRHYTS
jgi:hypothetical protein